MPQFASRYGNCIALIDRTGDDSSFDEDGDADRTTGEVVWVDKSKNGEGDALVDSYQLLNLRVGKALNWGTTGGEIFDKLQNLTNELLFSATTLNTVRGYTPVAGRSALVGVKLAF